MKEEDILSDALNQIKHGPIPAGPSRELADATVAKLNQADAQCPEHSRKGLFNKLITARSLPMLTLRFATAAVLVLIVGFAAGRMSGPTPSDVERLRSELEPALRDSVEKAIYAKVSEEIDQRWRSALETTCYALKEDLTRQYREDMSQFATQMLVASNTETNRLLGGLVQSLHEAKTQDMRRIAEAFYQLDRERRQDDDLIAEYIQNLADQTGSELERTKRQMYRLISNPNTED